MGNSGGNERAVEHCQRYTRLIHASAVSNGMYVFYANQAGRSGPASLCGLAFSMNPQGELVDCCAGREGMVVTEVSRQAIRKARQPHGEVSLAKVRPEAYAHPRIVHD